MKSRYDFSLDIEPLLRQLLKFLEKTEWILEIASTSDLISKDETELMNRCHKALFDCIFSIQESGSLQFVLNGQHVIAKWGVEEEDGECSKFINFSLDPSFEIDQEGVDTEAEE